jgi:hypothetical protein
VPFITCWQCWVFLLENEVKTYAEKLRDPRWQKKRLQIMDAARFECSCCGSKDKTLNVHHNYYEKGKNPWEYDDECLECLCENCHRERHLAKSILDKLLAKKTDILENVLGYAYKLAGGSESDFKSIKVMPFFGYEFIEGFIRASKRVSDREVYNMAKSTNQ